MPRQQIKLFVQENWSGGINLAADAKNVAQDEVVDAENVDLWPYGGFHRRKTVVRLNTTSFPIPSTVRPLNIGQYLKEAAFERIVVHIKNSTKDTVAVVEADGTWVPLGNDTAPWTFILAGRMRFATMARLTGASADVPMLYIQRNAERVPVRYDGTGVGVSLGVTFNDDLTTPNGGDMPQAKLLTTHRGFMWVANTLETAIARKNRVRWSHPNEPEDWRNNDFIDVGEGDDGDEIVGIASFAERLLVFKNRSIHVISGFDTDTFEAHKLTDAYGAVSQEAIAVSEFGVAFYDRRRGPMIWDGKQFRWLGEKLWPDIYEQVPQAFVTEACCTWFGPRLHVSVPWGAGETRPTRTFVYDTRIGKSGAWTRHSYGEGPGLHFRPVVGADMYLACSAYRPSLNQLEFNDDADSDGGGSVGATWLDGIVTIDTLIAHPFVIGDIVKITGHNPDGYNGTYAVQSVPSATEFTYALPNDPGAFVDGGSIDQYFVSSVTTAWFDAGLPGLRKRWRRPTFVFHNNQESVLGVQVWHDFDGARVVRQFSVNTQNVAGGMLWGDDWGSTWGATDEDASVVERGSGLGRAYAIRMRITGPVDRKWGLNAIDMRYIPNRIR